jgi:uncharacterized lipoprotein YbaY
MTKWLIIGLIALLAPMVLACTSGDDTADPTATPKPQPSRRGNKLIDGEITFKGLTSPISGGTIYVRLEDVSIQDEDAKTLVEQVIPNVNVDPSSPTKFKYLLEHRELDGKDTYKIRVHVDADNSGDLTAGDFARTESYGVTMALGSVVLNTINVVVDPVTIEAAELTKAVVRVEAPVEEVAVSRLPFDLNSYFVRVTSQQPDSCAQPNGYEVVRRIQDTDSIGINVYNVAPASAEVVCDQVISTVESDIVIGDDFEAGVVTAININGQVFFFTPGDRPTLEPTSKATPVFATLRGTIDFVAVTTPIFDATLYVRLEDLSRPDLGVKLVAERMIPNLATESSDPGRYRYVVQYQQPRDYGEYGIAVHLDVDNSGDVNAGDYVTTANYSFTGITPPNRMNVRATEVE